MIFWEFILECCSFFLIFIITVLSIYYILYYIILYTIYTIYYTTISRHSLIYFKVELVFKKGY